MWHPITEERKIRKVRFGMGLKNGTPSALETYKSQTQKREYEG
jgi:hypothetical protein